MKNQKAMMSSATAEWGTPQDLYDKLDAVYRFELDAAAIPENAKCRRFLSFDSRYFYMPEFDALDEYTDWAKLSGGGPIWLNPPYGRLAPKFVKRAEAELCNGVTIVCLVASRTDAQWFQFCFERAQVICFMPGRLKFLAFNGAELGPATFPSALVVFAPTLQAAKPRALSAFGPIRMNMVDAIKKDVA